MTQKGQKRTVKLFLCYKDFSSKITWKSNASIINNDINHEYSSTEIFVTCTCTCFVQKKILVLVKQSKTKIELLKLTKHYKLATSNNKEEKDKN